MIVARGKTARKPKKRKFPRAFWVVPVKIKARVPKHSHELGGVGVPPCPMGMRFAGKIAVGIITFCVYIDESGGEFLIQC